jgi:hypothetical protein
LKREQGCKKHAGRWYYADGAMLDWVHLRGLPQTELQKLLDQKIGFIGYGNHPNIWATKC